jgi:hypothetical protein
MNALPPGYSHTQRAPLYLVLYGSAVWLLVTAWLVREEPVVPFVLAAVGVLTAILGLAFHHLTVVDGGKGLVVRFGPLPLFRTTVPYSDIQGVEVGRTTIFDGWGIHLSLRGGWVWNIWGRDCVVIRRRKGILRVGTDDAPTLSRFLAGKIAGNAG